MKMGRDILMNSASSTTSCLYPSSNSHPRYRKRIHLILDAPRILRSRNPITDALHPNLLQLVVAACILCYANSLDGEFVHDDMVSITMNPDVIGENAVKEIFFNDFWESR
ncbi:uncharacterized protein CEXT_216581 [Caerostris extrusa]|uniref:Uncharacterized protein n=1 Tax=Caerostris extrusa TaxID=172846 RepID=A0AAV4YEI4_CAEEX|nr:uncharacterized protein CEXT_216581 [Caerostris extrusa]